MRCLSGRLGIGGVAILAISIAITLLPGTTAHAAPSSGCVWNGFTYDCTTTVGSAGSDGGGRSSSGKPGELTGRSTSCRLDGKTVPCSNRYGSLSNTADCQGYVDLTTPQPAPPSGALEGSGAWYTCTFSCVALGNAGGNTCLAGVGGIGYWSTAPPPGINRYTPAQAAAALARTFTLSPITIGMAPAKKVHVDDPVGTVAYRRTWAGIPVWLWVQNPTPLTFGPYRQTATLGQVSVTATASVSSVTWTTGDGQSVTCGPGTPFDETAMANRAAEDSPTCGFRYLHPSAGQLGNTWTVTATSHWAVSWTGGGQTGTIQLANLTATAPVQVGELQSVNLPVSDSILQGDQ